jgi:mRNA-decapping enzyme 1B
MASTGISSSAIEEQRRVANMRGLQRHDKSIREIVGSASHVVLYEFSEKEQQWEKRNVEGSLFVTKSVFDAYKVVILNRSSKENLDVAVTPNFQMQIREPYLIFRETASSILGIWFHDDDERTQVSNLLSNLVADLAKKDPPSAPSTPAPAPAPAPPVDAGAAASALLSPMTLDPNTSSSKSTPTGSGTTTPSRKSQQQPQQQTLDKKSLQLALLSLVQDDRFLDLIHAQYVKVAHAREQKLKQSGNGP